MSQRASAKQHRVYPRACGGTALDVELDNQDQGLSPRLRGNPRPFWCRFKEGGSIPAPAGEPPRTSPTTCPARVYPRACGGTEDLLDTDGIVAGLSPRLRGNQGLAFFGICCMGSIPAPAGEPQQRIRELECQKVYPRACGGTFVELTTRGKRKGLSPRLRGNLQKHVKIGAREGSIPAPAGEPASVTPGP